ncbi:hypothetical protein ABT063_18750 [Streptomyces sp. NPDC002838]|uniref:hypothetical protein n=1 Tax=Streptomyces sp. NPDC002838 TaxID=3154436 RepID=UPI003326134B
MNGRQQHVQGRRVRGSSVLSDNCRRHFPGQGASFTPFVFRQDLLMLHGSACDECTASFETKGVTVKDL